MRAARTALAVLALFALAGCGASAPEAPQIPAGYTKIGSVDGVSVYAQVSADGSTVEAMMRDDQDAKRTCGGSGSVSQGVAAELCKDSTKTGFLYLAAAGPADFFKACDISTGAAVPVEKLTGPADWKLVFYVAQSRTKDTVVTQCL